MVFRAGESGQLRLSESAGRWVLLASVLGSGLAGIDMTVVNIALPSIGDDLDASFGGLQWTVTGYTLTLASFILLGGSLGDRFGRRRVFVIGVGWFAVASGLCALAPTVDSLIAARALQGVGGALLTPGSLAIISASFVEEDRGRAIGAWSGFGGIATAIGPFLGGYLVGGPGWRWIFVINLPLAVLVIAVALRHVPETGDPEAIPHIDALGAGLGVVGLAGVTYALISSGDGWSYLLVVTGLVGVASLAGFVMVERHSAHPMLPMRIFANRQFSATNAVTFVVYAALGANFFLLVVDLQVVGGFSPLLAGSALLPVTAIMLAFSARSGAFAARIGPRRQMTLGPWMAAAGVLLMLRLGPGVSYLAGVLPAVVVFGAGLTLFVAPLTTTVLAAADTRYAGIASGVNNAVARAAGLLAVATLPVVAGISGGDYRHAASFQHGFRISMLVCAALLFAGGAISVVFLKDRPEATHGEQPKCPHQCELAGPPLRASQSVGTVPKE